MSNFRLIGKVDGSINRFDRAAILTTPYATLFIQSEDDEMAQTASSSDLYTTVKNISGATRQFGYLGDHGVRLANNQTYTHRGDLMAKLGARLSRRQFDAFAAALSRGDLEIISSPAVYLRDAGHSLTRRVALHLGELGLVDPSWDAGGSAAFNDGSA